MERVIIGIDISKASFTAAVWDGEQVIDLGELPNTQAGYEALGRHALSWQQRGAVAGIHLILEVTGGYELGLVAYAYPKLGQSACLTHGRYAIGRALRGNAPRTTAWMHGC